MIDLTKNHMLLVGRNLFNSPTFTCDNCLHDCYEEIERIEEPEANIDISIMMCQECYESIMLSNKPVIDSEVPVIIEFTRNTPEYGVEDDFDDFLPVYMGEDDDDE